MDWFYPSLYLTKAAPFVGGWLADRLLGDPAGWPHPIIGFGRLISWGEKQLNTGGKQKWKGGMLACLLIGGTFVSCLMLLRCAELVHPLLGVLLTATGVFFCLAGKTLIQEVKAVFKAVGECVEAGRTQVGRIVGRDTSRLSAQEIRTAALETLSENLSDGVIAPMFWFLLLGLPGMMAYKMVNTLDSMIGYKTERYREFGCVAARLDDAANYLPARLTAGLMLLVSGKWRRFRFVKQFGRAHASPNSGYPEAALAAILDCRFGGTHDYFGQPVEKPYIGTNDRELTQTDLQTAIRTNNRTELAMGIAVCLSSLFIQ